MLELGDEAVSDLDARLEAVVDWQESYHTGVIDSLRRDASVEFCCGTCGAVEAAKAFIAVVKRSRQRH